MCAAAIPNATATPEIAISAEIVISAEIASSAETNYTMQLWLILTWHGAFRFPLPNIERGCCSSSCYETTSAVPFLEYPLPTLSSSYDTLSLEHGVAPLRACTILGRQVPYLDACGWYDVSGVACVRCRWNACSVSA